MKIFNFLLNSLTLNKNHKSISWSLYSMMILSAFTITFPLIIGLWFKQFSISMFGALFSLILILNDQEGPFYPRFKHLFITFLTLTISIYLGSLAIGHTLLIYFMLFISTFFLGKSKNQGIELERLTLFSILYFITVSDSPSLKSNILIPFYYTLLSFLFYIIILGLLLYFKNDSKNSINSKYETLKKSFKQNDSNSFSLLLAFGSVFSIYLAKKFQIERPYWITGTFIIVMLPDHIQSFNKAFQRVFGTILGVFFAVVLLSIFTSNFTIIIWILIFAFFTPLGMAVNYWVGNFFIASLIIFFMETNSIKPDVFNLALLRVIDIGLGCILGIILINAFTFFKNAVKRINH